LIRFEDNWSLLAMSRLTQIRIYQENFCSGEKGREKAKYTMGSRKIITGPIHEYIEERAMLPVKE